MTSRNKRKRKKRQSNIISLNKRRKFANINATADKSKEFLQAILDEIKELADICGLIVEKEDGILDADIEALIAERTAAKKEKNFARADAIRNELLEKGIILEDTREGVKWKRA